MPGPRLIDLFAAPALVVDGTLDILNGNPEGMRWVEGMGLPAGSLSSLPEADALRAAVATALTGTDDGVENEIVLAGPERRHRVTILKLAENGQAVARIKPVTHARPFCILVIRSQNADSLVEVVRQHGLTRSEARIASLLVQGYSLAKVSELMGVSRETVRTHLKSVFAKTGTKRQAELVILLSRDNP
jgi:DNA-binding CsgD family transcriptional regulator